MSGPTGPYYSAQSPSFGAPLHAPGGSAGYDFQTIPTGPSVSIGQPSGTAYVPSYAYGQQPGPYGQQPGTYGQQPMGSYPGMMPSGQPVGPDGIPYAQSVVPPQPASVFVNAQPLQPNSGYDVLPTAADQPIFEPGAKDVWAGIMFWVHAIVIIGLAFGLGIPAMRADGKAGDDAPNRQTLDLNASLVVRMLVLATFVAGAVSALFFHVLQRYGGRMIKCSLYTSAVIQLVVCAITFAFAPVAAVFLLISAAATLLYIYFVRSRIAFAAANLETACDAVRAHRSALFTIALLLLVAQALWIFFWSAAAVGVQHSINVNSGAAVAPDADGGNGSSGQGGQSGTAKGGILVFVMLVSFFWGAQVFKDAMHFITASVVGNWWFLGNVPAVITGSLYRAFVTNFGSIALASLITSVIRALETIARSASRSRGDRDGGVRVFVAACAACLLRCIEGIVEYFNKWALVYAALTGSKYTHAGSEVINLFKKRGWTAIINDDLTGSAMAIGCLMVGAVSAVLGGGVAYVFMHGAANGSAAGIVAFLSFVVGVAMAMIMTGIISSAVKTVFVCFALNPAALGATHPNHLATLVVAWHAAHPQDFERCGYLSAYGGQPVGGMRGMGPGGWPQMV